MRTRSLGVAVAVGAGILLVAGCRSFGQPLTPVAPAVAVARSGPVAVVPGDRGPVASRAAWAIARALRRDGVKLVPAKVVARARQSFADDLPLSTTGAYMDKRRHPETANPALGAQLLRAMGAPVVYVVWGPPLKDVGHGYTVETLAGQLYVNGASGARLLGYTRYRLVIGTWWRDARIDRVTDAAGAAVARAVEARLGER